MFELTGTLSLGNVDYVSRELAAKPRPQFVIFDLRRVASITRAGARLLAEEFGELERLRVTVILSGITPRSTDWKALGEWTSSLSNVRDFYLLDTAIEWAEDQVVYRHGGAIDFLETIELSEQLLLAGLSEAELTELASISAVKTYRAARRSSLRAMPQTRCFSCEAGRST